MVTTRHWMLSIGVNEYGSQLHLPNLQCAVNDACLIYDVFASEYNFQGALLARPRDVAAGVHSHLANEARAHGSREDIIEQINQLRRRMSPNDLFVLFYSGHGTGERPGFIVPFGAEWGRTSSYLMYRTLYGELSALPCRQQALFFDCCYSGAALDGIGEKASAPQDGPSRVVAFAATSRDDVTPDRLPAIGDGNHSPFAWALRDYLLEHVGRGNAFEPADFETYLRKRYAEWACPTEPDVQHEVPAVRPGRGRLQIRRSGLRIGVETRYECRVGDCLEVPLEAQSGFAQGEFEWAAKPRLAGFEPLLNSIEQRDCWIWRSQFAFAGVFDFDLSVTAADATGESETAALTVQIAVQPAVMQPLSVPPASLSVCLKGVPYEGRIEASGGYPFSDGYRWRVTGLPSPLTVQGLPSNPEQDFIGKSIRIAGVVPEAPDAGSPKAHDESPIAYRLLVEVTDAAGAKCGAELRLPVVSPKDYVAIPAGTFQVGYVSTPAREEAIYRMMRAFVCKLFGVAPASPMAEEPEIQRTIAGRIQSLKNEVLSVNPGGTAGLFAYYIKKYPVTNREWHEFVKAHPDNPSYLPLEWHGRYPEEQGAFPVVNVSYEAICAYLDWKGTRLPTAWEWERAARGTDGRLFPWGDEFDFDKCNTLGNDSGKALVPVDRYDDRYPPDIEVRDIVGNAAEWVDRRVYQRGPRMVAGVKYPFYFAQIFRGGSFMDEPAQALVFCDSPETALLFGPDREGHVIGDAQMGLPWVGFRDVVDLHADPALLQGWEIVPANQVRNLDGTLQPVPAFAMARYAVSNLEYLEFVRGALYPPPTSWSPHADTPFPWAQRHLPVVDVSFRDALAFCLWKSRETKQIVRLPSEAQWRAAAGGGQHLAFPWGDQYDLQKCNGCTSGWARRLPVFALPEGMSRQGIFNLVGNVCEWVTPEHVYGGSWQDDCQKAASQGFCLSVQPPYRGRGDVGFRYVANANLEGLLP